jgi:hypothetical protein
MRYFDIFSAAKLKNRDAAGKREAEAGRGRDEEGQAGSEISLLGI